MGGSWSLARVIQGGDNGAAGGGTSCSSSGGDGFEASFFPRLVKPGGVLTGEEKKLDGEVGGEERQGDSNPFRMIGLMSGEVGWVYSSGELGGSKVNGDMARTRFRFGAEGQGGGIFNAGVDDKVGSGAEAFLFLKMEGSVGWTRGRGGGREVDGSAGRDSSVKVIRVTTSITPRSTGRIVDTNSIRRVAPSSA